MVSYQEKLPMKIISGQLLKATIVIQTVLPALPLLPRKKPSCICLSQGDIIFVFAPQGAEYCPETASLKWEWYGTKPDNSLGWIEDSDAGLRCSDCAKFPNADECSKKVLSGWVIHFFHH